MVPAADPVPLVTDAADSLHPSWSPTGDSVVFASPRDGNFQLWLAPVADGRASGEPSATTRQSPPTPPSGNGTELACVQTGHDTDIWVTRVGITSCDQTRDGRRRGALSFKWDPTRRSLFVSGSWQEGQVSLRRVDPDTGAITRFDPPVVIGHPSGYPVFDVSSCDGRFVALSRNAWAGDIWVADIIRKQP